MDVKPIDAAATEGLKKDEGPVKPVEGEVKRQEPPVPHAPQDNPLQNAPDQKNVGEEEQIKNEKRQLMSKSEDEKATNSETPVEKDEKLNAVEGNAININPVKVSEQEIDEELKKLEQSDKVF